MEIIFFCVNICREMFWDIFFFLNFIWEKVVGGWINMGICFVVCLYIC